MFYVYRQYVTGQHHYEIYNMRPKMDFFFGTSDSFSHTSTVAPEAN